ncbi:uncharacterized protein LOC111135322 [Crassostrea virginica]
MYYVVIMLVIRWTSGQNNFFKVQSCTDIKLRDIPEEVFEKCKEPDMVIHCLPDENDNLGLSCFSVTWIEEGGCPYYNSYQGNMDERKCDPRYGSCSPGLYKSPSSLSYKGCYAKEYDTTTIAVTTTEMETIPPVKCPMNDAVANRTNNTSSEICEECTCATEIAVAVILTLFILGCCIGVGVAVIFYRKLRKKYGHNSNDIQMKSHSDDNGKNQPFLPDANNTAG